MVNRDTEGTLQWNRHFDPIISLSLKKSIKQGDSSAISTRAAVLLIAVTTPVRALVQTGEPPNLARKGDPIGLTAEAGGFARPRPPFGRCPGLTALTLPKTFTS